jgi:hypothetical protein
MGLPDAAWVAAVAAVGSVSVRDSAVDTADMGAVTGDMGNDQLESDKYSQQMMME